MRRPGNRLQHIDRQIRALTATVIILTAILNGYVFYLVFTGTRTWWNPLFILVAIIATITTNHALDAENEAE